MDTDEQKKIKIVDWIQSLNSEEFLQLLHLTTKGLLLEKELRNIIGGTVEYIQKKLVGKETFYVLEQLQKNGIIKVNPMILASETPEGEEKVILFENEISIFPDIKEIAGVEIFLDDNFYFFLSKLDQKLGNNNTGTATQLLQYFPDKNQKYKKLRILAKIYEQNSRYSLAQVAVKLHFIRTQGAYNKSSEKKLREKIEHHQRTFNKILRKHNIEKKLSFQKDYLILK